MVTKILFWSGFGTSHLLPFLLSSLLPHSFPPPLHTQQLTTQTGVAVRLWQLGIEMRPLFHRSYMWAYPVYAAVGGSFGYWLTGVESRQLAVLEERKQRLLEKRARRDTVRVGTPSQLLEESQMATR